MPKTDNKKRGHNMAKNVLRSGTRTKWSGKRHIVQRDERGGPLPPEAAQHKREWPMKQLYEANKISMNQYETAVHIVEAFRFITGIVGFKPLDLARIGHAHGEIGDAGERRFAIYKRWGDSIQAPVIKGGLLVRPHVIVEMIQDDRPIHSSTLKTLCSAIDRWRDYSDEYDKEKQAETNSSARRHTIMIDAME